MSIDRFGMELASYLKDKGDDYRLILLADEVRQIINKERDRYLNLQEINTKLSEACDNKVWVACTAQQDLSEIMDDCHIAEEKDKEGKIKGRFEVKVSLKGTQPEVITQKRILDKKEKVKQELAALYNKYKAGLDLQFNLPTSYSSYETQDDFVDSEIMDDCHIAEEKDKEGKIKGRFEVKVSLKGTQPEVITQKRILDKKEEVKPELAALYNKYKAGFDLQFKLPTSYSSYETQDDFVDYYPFVPYQFKLIMQVFNSFLNLGYVAKEVKGNERSIIKVIHSTAKTNADAELGKFISFDELYNNMFEEGLQARGQKAVDNALRMARTYQTDRPERTRLAVRVANVLFMICNISQTDQLVFPATLDNVTSLLINDMETPRLNIKNEVEKVIEFLCDNNIIRREQGKNGAPETYAFYSEEEMKVAQLIQSQVVDNNTQAEQLKEIFNRYITALRNKEQYKTRSFSVGLTIKQRTFLSNNPDVQVEFVMDADYETAEQLALQNSNVNRMVYYVGPQYRDNKRLYNAFYWYCQANRYMATPVTSEDNKKTRDEFEKRANEFYDGIIRKEFEKILDTCPIISGLSVIDEAELGQKRGNDRYRVAMDKHLSGIYTKANLVDYPSMPRTTEQLKKAILRNVNPGDYEGMNAVLTDAEHEVEIYLNKQFAEVNVSDVLAKFAKAPYGWDNICTLYIINELVRRHNRDYSYANNPNVETSTVANRIVSESSKFTLRQAKVISPQVIQNFIASWKEIFGISAVPSSTDSTQLFRACRDIESDRSLAKFIKGYKDIEQQIAGYQFCQPIREAIDLFESWLNERDPLKFFNLVIAAKDEAKVLIDKCKEVVQFTHDQLDTYKQLIQFQDNNQYNFPFVPMEMQGAVTDFSKLKDDPWPISGLRGYIKLQRQLSGILDGVRNELREKIKAAYNEIFDYLKQVAEKQHVPESVLSDRETVIRVKTTPTNILVLQNNANTDTFYQEQVDKIMSYNPPLPPGGEGDGKPEPPKTPDKRIRKASLQTKTKLPITNAEDIERYLEGLRQQLEKLLIDQDGVMIIK